MSRKISLVWIVLILLAFSSRLSLAQTTATVTGVVTDPSGAVIPGADVVLSNRGTAVRYTVKTDSAGSYRIANVPPGPGYSLQFTASGFSAIQVNDLYVNVANVLTQNAKLALGPAATEVEVNANAAAVTLNTTDASIGNNFQVEKLNDLPVYSRNSPAILFTLQPGITVTGATTGARTDQTDTTVDGLDVNDFATGNFQSITGNAPIDSVQEFRGTTAGFTADSGPGGGGQFQLVTRSGTNQWHGNINEYHRDNSTTANNWFDDEVGIPQPKLVQNQFGGALGGPILHDRAFFFFDYLNSRIAQQSAVVRTVPLASLAAGNVSYINDADGCTDSSRQNTTPSCISALTPAQVQAMDPAGLGDSPQLLTLLKSYPAANDLSAGDGVNSGGYRFNAPTPDNLSNYVGRVDWDVSGRIRLYGIGTVARENDVQSAAQFPGDPPAGQFVDRSYRYVVGMSWQIAANKFNQLFYGSVVQDWQFPRPANPEGVYQLSFSSGTTQLLDSPYSSPANAQGRHVPISSINDNFTWTVGRHSIQMGGYFKWINSNEHTTLDYNTYTLGLGGEVQGLTPALRPADILPAGAPGGDANALVTYDSAFTTILGRIGALNSTFNYNAAGNVLTQPSGSVRHYRYYQTQPYVADTWKVTPNLTLTVGLNYQYFTVPYEVNGLETVQDTGFDQYFSARLAQSAAGVSGPAAVPFITYVLGGPANHGPSLYHADPYNFAPRVAVAYNPRFDPNTVFNASAGIVYDRTIIDAVQYQQTQYSYFFQQMAAQSYGNGTDPAGSLATDPRLSSPPPAVVPPTPKAPFQPYANAAQCDALGLAPPCGLQDGFAFNEMIDPNLKTPYSILLTAGMQHMFPGQYMLKINYAGRLGRRLLAQADANQLIDFPDAASGQLMSQAMAHITTEARAGADPTNLPAEPWWENQLPPGFGVANGFPNTTSLVATALNTLVTKGDFADTIQALSPYLNYNVGMGAQFSENTVYTNKGFSSYNGLLVTLQKNYSHGLQFDVNYTFSHSIDNVSLIANQIAFGGYGFICDAVRPRECRGNSDFDTTHVLSSDFLYSLPFGRGRGYANHLPWAVDALIGGWDVSGIPTWHSGTAYTAVSDAFVAGYANNAPAILVGSRSAIRHDLHKDPSGAVYLYPDSAAAAAAFTGPVGLQIGSRNILRGPQYFNMDAGLAKVFRLSESGRWVLKLRGDAFNVLNHPNFNQLNFFDYSNYVDITQPSNFGQLTALNGNPRVVQISGRIEF